MRAHTLPNPSLQDPSRSLPGPSSPTGHPGPSPWKVGHPGWSVPLLAREVSTLSSDDNILNINVKPLLNTCLLERDKFIRAPAPTKVWPDRRQSAGRAFLRSLLPRLLLCFSFFPTGPRNRLKRPTLQSEKGKRDGIRRGDTGRGEGPEVTRSHSRTDTRRRLFRSPSDGVTGRRGLEGQSASPRCAPRGEQA